MRVGRVRIVEIAAAVLLPLLAACSGDETHIPLLQSYRATLAQAPVCCQDIRSLPYAPLPVGDSWTVSFRTDTPAYTFVTGKSYFAAYRIPDGALPLRLVVRTPLGTGMVQPVILLLDRDFNNGRLIGQAAFRLDVDALGANRFVTATVLLGRSDPPPRYIIFLTSDATLAGRTVLGDPLDPTVVPGMAPQWTQPLNSRPYQREVYDHSPIGSFRVTTERHS